MRNWFRDSMLPYPTECVFVRVNGASSIKPHVKSFPCRHGMERPQVADGGDGLQLWIVAANIFNKQSLTADKG
jgi:hypothetical protein